VDLRRKRGKQEAQADQRASTKPIDHDGVLPSLSLLSRRILADVRSFAKPRRSKQCGTA
jgi:hypothetical protein